MNYGFSSTSWALKKEFPEQLKEAVILQAKYKFSGLIFKLRIKKLVLLSYQANQHQ